MDKLLVISIIGIGVFFGTLTGLIYSFAQTTSIDKVFIKDFCSSEIDLLAGINYTNGDELSYDSAGCPISVKIIHRWDELSISNQNIITAKLTVEGYNEQNITTALNQGHNN